MTRRLPWVLTSVIMLVGLAVISAAALRLGAAESTSEIVMSIRAPRVVMALVVGMGLAVAGVLLQGSLRNPRSPWRTT